MASIWYLRSAVEDLDRLGAFLHESDPAAALETAQLIVDSLRVLSDHPLIGRPAGPDRRELVIYRGRTGYLAQYQYASDKVAIVAIRHPWEADL